MVMIGFVFIAVVICAAVVIWKYLDETAMNDMSYGRYREVMNGIEEIKQMLKNNNKEE